MPAFLLVVTYDLSEVRCKNNVIIDSILLPYYYIKQIDFILLWVCSAVDHRRHNNVVRTSVTYSAAPPVPLFCAYHILLYLLQKKMHGNIESIFNQN